jgi:hypothetical protein
LGNKRIRILGHWDDFCQENRLLSSLEFLTGVLVDNRLAGKWSGGYSVAKQ